MQYERNANAIWKQKHILGRGSFKSTSFQIHLSCDQLKHSHKEKTNNPLFIGTLVASLIVYWLLKPEPIKSFLYRKTHTTWAEGSRNKVLHRDVGFKIHRPLNKNLWWAILILPHVYTNVRSVNVQFVTGWPLNLKTKILIYSKMQFFRFFCLSVYVCLSNDKCTSRIRKKMPPTWCVELKDVLTPQITCQLIFVCFPEKWHRDLYCL